MAARKKKSKLIGVIILLIVIIVIGLILRFVVYDKAKAKITSAIATKLLEEQMPEGVSQQQVETAQQIYDSLSNEDRGKVEDLIESKVDAKTVADVSTYLKNNDKEGLKEYVKSTFSEQEIQEIRDLYQKYQ
ncbi:MAG: hypothetical protein ACI4C5_10175 [Lachnospiraceae bacterium]